MATLRVKGGPEIRALFDKLKIENKLQILENALVAGALEITNQAAKNAPFVSGNLRRSMTQGQPEYFKPETTSKKKENVTIVAGTNVEYARRVEFGFSGADKKGRVYSQKEKPYLRPAFQSEKEQAIKTTKAALSDQLKLK